MAAGFEDYYAVLGVAADATPDAIKQAFRALARLYHPDVAKDKATAGAKFQAINEANEVLGDPGRRADYDRLRAARRVRAGGHRFDADDLRGDDGDAEDAGGDFNFEGTGFSDFFARHFGGGRDGDPPGRGDGRFRTAGTAGSFGSARRGADIVGDISVTLAEVLHGSERPVSLRHPDPRSGREETQTFTLRIPPGAAAGRRLRMAGRGEPGRGGAPAGDLFLRVRYAAHPDFDTDGADLIRTLPVAPWEAVLGAAVTVATLDGAIRLRIPAGSAPGTRIRVPGRGLPMGKSGGRGDFFVVLDVQLPRLPDAAERGLWEQLRDRSTFRPRAEPAAP